MTVYLIPLACLGKTEECRAAMEAWLASLPGEFVCFHGDRYAIVRT